MFPALRIDIFYQKEEHSPLIPIKEKKEEKKTEEIKDPVFILKRKKGRVLARMMIREGKYYLLENSHLVLKSAWTNTVPPSLGSKYDKLCSKNMLIEKEEYCLVAEEIEFSSSSAAAVIVYGAGVGGSALWRLEGTNMTLKKWQAEKEAQEVRLETGEGE